MSTEAGKLEVVSVIDGPAPAANDSGKADVTSVFGNGLIVMKVHRSPHSAGSQGDLIIARRNPDALWLSDYEDRIIYDGRLQGADKYRSPLVTLEEASSCTSAPLRA